MKSDEGKAVRGTAPRVLLVAGEASGDLHAADLIAALRVLVPGVQVWGVGGAGARAEGMKTAVDSAEIATFGLTEVIEKSRAILRTYRLLRRTIRRNPPDLVVLIDFPEFNLAVARLAKRRGVPVFYYVSPQVWAWRPGRVQKILSRVDRLAVIFPFELAAYGNSEKVVFVGHPLLDRVRATASREETFARHGLTPGSPLVLLLPGSRRREIERLLPVMAEAAERLAKRRPVQVALALAPTVSREFVERVLGELQTHCRVIENDTYNLISASALVLAASGTATLETALLERPMVLMYRASRITYFVARRLVNVPAIGMPNLIAGRKIVPELMQDEVCPERIAAEAEAILGDPRREQEIRSDLAAVRAALGSGGAAARAARLAADLLRAAP